MLPKIPAYDNRYTEISQFIIYKRAVIAYAKKANL